MRLAGSSPLRFPNLYALPLPPPSHTATAPLLLPSSSRQATERMKFVFDWDANEDTSRDLNPLYQNLHGAAARWAVHSG